MRLRERRRYDYAGNPPPLATALRQLRMRVLDARGPGLGRFAERAKSLAVLAQIQDQPDAAVELSRLAASAVRARGDDVRPAFYGALDSIHATLRA